MKKLLAKIKAALATTEGKLKAFILITGLTLAALVISVGAMELTSTPLFCQSCHEMRPEYVTWKASAHNQFSCTQCHIPPGTKNFVVHKVNSLKELYKHFTGQVYAPITEDETIKDEVCEQCHSVNRVATPSGDIKIPHKVHKDNNVPCVKCHQAVAHANINEEGFTADADWSKWIEPVGKIYMKSDFRKFSMTECLDCHKEQGAGPKPDDCEACHNKLIKPENHKTEKFLTDHGSMAEQDIAQCDRCHKITKNSKVVDSPSQNKGVKYARNNDFCSGCHTKTKPPNHQANWKQAHAISALDDRDGCLVCHSETKPSRKTVGAKTYCYQCHVPQLHVAVKNGLHPRYPLGTNPTISREPCMLCHSEKTCSKCHYIPGTSGARIVPKRTPNGALPNNGAVKPGQNDNPNAPGPPVETGP